MLLYFISFEGFSNFALRKVKLQFPQFQLYFLFFFMCFKMHL